MGCQTQTTNMGAAQSRMFIPHIIRIVHGIFTKHNRRGDAEGDAGGGEGGEGAGEGGGAEEGEEEEEVEDAEKKREEECL
jgi:hypothetical protein